MKPVMTKHLEKMRFKNQRILHNCVNSPIQKIVIYGKSQQPVCSEKVFNYTFNPTEQSKQSIRNLFSDIDGECAIWAKVDVEKFCDYYGVYIIAEKYIADVSSNFTSEHSTYITLEGEEAESSWLGGDATGSFSIDSKAKEMCLLYKQPLLGQETINAHNTEFHSEHIDVGVTITRYALPCAEMPTAFTLLNTINLTIGKQMITLTDYILRSKENVADKLVIDVENKQAYVERYIQVDVEESNQLNIYDGYTIFTEPIIEAIPWSRDFELITTNGNNEVINNSNVQTEIDVYYYAKGFIDGLPPVRDGLISVYDGYNNAGRTGEWDFIYPGQDLIRKSSLDYSGYKCNTGHPYGRKGLYLGGNEELADMVEELGNKVVEYTSDDGTTYNYSMLKYDNLGMLEPMERTMVDGEWDYPCVIHPEGTYLPYSYVEYNANPCGNVSITLPDDLMYDGNITIQIIAQLTNKMDTFYCGVMNDTEIQDLVESRAMAIDPFKDYLLLINNLKGVSKAYINNSCVYQGITFTDDVTLCPQGFYIGFHKEDEAKNNYMYRKMYIYSVYIYNRVLSDDEVKRNMEYAGQRYGYHSYCRKFPKLEDNGECQAFIEGLKYIGYLNGISDEKMKERIQEIAEINREHCLYLEQDSAEFNEKMLQRMRDGNLLRPTSWNNRLKLFTESGGK